MRHLIYLLIYLLLHLSFVYALTLAEVLAQVPNQANILTLQLELQDAEQSLSRIQGDPLGLRPDLVKAEHRLALAQADLQRANYQAALDLTTAYTEVIEARAQLNISTQQVALAERFLEGARVRQRNGSATALDVEDANTTFEKAQKDLRFSQEKLALAKNQLETFLNTAVDPASLALIPERGLVSLPQIEAVLAVSEQHPDRLTSRQSLEIARLDYETLSPIYAAPVEIELARTQLEAARGAESTQQEGFALEVRRLYAQVISTGEAYIVEQTALANARTRHSSQRQRFEQGLLSEVDSRQAELDAVVAEFDALKAYNDYLKSLLTLQVGTMMDLAIGLGSN